MIRGTVFGFRKDLGFCLCFTKASSMALDKLLNPRCLCFLSFEMGIISSSKNYCRIWMKWIYSALHSVNDSYYFYKDNDFPVPSMDSDSVSMSWFTTCNVNTCLSLPTPEWSSGRQLASSFLPPPSKTFKEDSTISFCQNLTKFKLFLVSNPNLSPPFQPVSSSSILSRDRKALLSSLSMRDSQI